MISVYANLNSGVYCLKARRKAQHLGVAYAIMRDTYFYSKRHTQLQKKKNKKTKKKTKQKKKEREKTFPWIKDGEMLRYVFLL